MIEPADPQQEARALIWGTLWDPPCQHLGREWTIDAEGTGRCGMCLATWTMTDERDREARKAAGPPEGESDRDRMWREFREATWRGRPLIMSIPPGREAGTPPGARAAYETCWFWESHHETCRFESLIPGSEPCADCPGQDGAPTAASAPESPATT